MPTAASGSPRPLIPSPLVLCDRLLTLAQDADRAGFIITAEHLLHLAHVVFDEPIRRPANRAQAPSSAPSNTSTRQPRRLSEKRQNIRRAG